MEEENMQICFTDHARQRLSERKANYGAIRDRVKEAAQMLAGKGRVRAALVGQEPPIIVEFRPPARATVVTVLPREAGAGGKIVKVTC
jgi:hypothetical protein